MAKNSWEPFKALDKVFGDNYLSKAKKSHVAVIGLGGVGSWAVECLVRSGVGEITLVDFDEVCISNVNRQLPALHSTLGYAKVSVLKNRVLDINPDLKINTVQDFFTHENYDKIFQLNFSHVIDAIDSIKAKTLLVAECYQRGIFVVTCGAAGGKMDSEKIQISDLALSQYDPLLAKLRKLLRKENGFPTKIGKKFGIMSVYSVEKSRQTESCGAKGRLDCNSGYGSAVHITSLFGIKAAEIVIKEISKVRV